ncbi:MAG: type II and III secretion system protein [Elusimicrobia bacterium]|nr:type II and III secretion system protein [Elusimicrobiota bacterium]
MRRWVAITVISLFWPIWSSGGFGQGQTGGLAGGGGLEHPLIQVSVEVVEADMQRSRRLGVQWLDALHLEEASVPGLLSVGMLQRGKLFADLQVLLERGAADLLANPKLITQSGAPASFHAGGEIPYLSAAGLGTTHVVFKPYGVHLEVTPRSESGGMIHLLLKAGVSSPDSAVSVSLSGNTVPGLLTRDVSTELTIRNGTTVTLAGLIQTRKETKTSGVPLLSELPLIGIFFSQQKVVHSRTSLVLFVTPTLLENVP